MDGRYLKVEHIRLSIGDVEVTREVVRHPGAVAVVPEEDSRIWLIRQYRAAIDEEILEIPAGVRDRTGESPEETARRELGEEMGIRAESVSSLATMLPAPGYTDEEIEIFHARGLSFGERDPKGPEEVSATIVNMPLDEALLSIRTGEIIDAKTQIAIMMLDIRRKT